MTKKRRRSQPRDRRGRFVKKGNGTGTDFLVGAFRNTFNRQNFEKRKREMRRELSRKNSPLSFIARRMGLNLGGNGLATDAIVNNLTNQVNRRIGDAATETVDGIFDAGLNRLKRLFKRKKKPKPKTSVDTRATPDLSQLSAIDRRRLGL